MGAPAFSWSQETDGPKLLRQFKVWCYQVTGFKGGKQETAQGREFLLFPLPYHFQKATDTSFTAQRPRLATWPHPLTRRMGHLPWDQGTLCLLPAYILSCHPVKMTDVSCFLEFSTDISHLLKKWKLDSLSRVLVLISSVSIQLV